MDPINSSTNVIMIIKMMMIREGHSKEKQRPRGMCFAYNSGWNRGYKRVQKLGEGAGLGGRGGPLRALGQKKVWT